jgi:hypothetical protein
MDSYSFHTSLWPTIAIYFTEDHHKYTQMIILMAVEPLKSLRQLTDS